MSIWEIWLEKRAKNENNLLIEEYFFESVDNNQLTHHKKQIFFRDFDHFVQIIHHRLTSIRIGKARNSRNIAISLPISTEEIACELAIMESNCVFVPIDKESAFSQQLLLMKNADVEFLICQPDSSFISYLSDKQIRHHVYSVAEGNDKDVGLLLPFSSICIVQLIEYQFKENTSQINEKIHCEDAMYILHTSGTTGTPKGIIGSHSATFHRLKWMWEKYPFLDSNRERVMRVTKLRFVDSLWEIFGCLLQNVPLVIAVINKSNYLPNSLPSLKRSRVLNGQCMNSHFILDNLPYWSQIMKICRISRITLIPCILKSILLVFEHKRFSNSKLYLRYCLVSSDVLPPRTLKLAMSCLPRTVFIHLYGCTEVSGDTTWIDFQKGRWNKMWDEIGVPIGFLSKPICQLNSRIELRIGNKVIREEKIRGELWVSGILVSLGYYLKERQTVENEYFSVNKKGQRWYCTGDICWFEKDFLYFDRRNDNQVQINGNRIEINGIKRIFQKYLPQPDQRSLDIVPTCPPLNSDSNKKLLRIEVQGKPLSVLQQKNLLEKSKKYIALNDIPFVLNNSSSKKRKLNDDAIAKDTDEVVNFFFKTWYKMMKYNSCNDMCGSDPKDVMNYSFQDLGGDSITWTEFIFRLNSVYYSFENIFNKFPFELSTYPLSELREYILAVTSSFEKTLRGQEESIKIALDNRNTDSTVPKICWSVDCGKCVDASVLLVDKADQFLYGIVGSHACKLTCMNLNKNGEIVWVTKLGGRIESTCAICTCQDVAFVGCYDFCVYAINVYSGLIKWSFSTHGEVKCSPIVVEACKLLLIGSYDSAIYGLEPHAGQWLFEVRMLGSVYASPAFDLENSLLYGASTKGELKCWKYDLYNNSIRGVSWECEFEAPIFGSIRFIFETKQIIISCANGALYLMNSLTGDLCWKYETTKPIFCTPHYFFSSLGECLIISGSHDGIQRCLSAKTGKVMWSFSSGDSIFSSCTVLSTHIDFCVCASTKGNVYILNGVTGNEVEKIQLPGEVFSNPVVEPTSNRILIGCRDNNTYCLEFECLRY